MGLIYDLWFDAHARDLPVTQVLELSQRLWPSRIFFKQCLDFEAVIHIHVHVHAFVEGTGQAYHGLPITDTLLIEMHSLLVAVFLHHFRDFLTTLLAIVDQAHQAHRANQANQAGRKNLKEICQWMTCQTWRQNFQLLRLGVITWMFLLVALRILRTLRLQK